METDRIIFAREKLGLRDAARIEIFKHDKLVKVIKVNNGVMRRNFIHVQDGSGSGETANLIFTSQQTAVVGDKITVTGTVVLDTDFGMGYFYATLIEEATLELAAHP